MATLVYQWALLNSDADPTAILRDLLRMAVPPAFPDTVVVPFMDVGTDRSSDIGRLMRRGRVFTRDELVGLLDDAVVTAGWFFVGGPGRPGDAAPVVDVRTVLAASAFAADVLEGRYLTVRTTDPDVFHAAAEVAVGGEAIEPCELSEVRLMY